MVPEVGQHPQADAPPVPAVREESEARRMRADVEDDVPLFRKQWDPCSCRPDSWVANGCLKKGALGHMPSDNIKQNHFSIVSRLPAWLICSSSEG